jgi:ADP-dependent phosphofructokinase/glucokinase
MRIICGYNVNLDMVCTVTSDEITKHIVEHRLLEKVLKKLESPIEGIYSIEDFFCGLLLHMKSGSGAEWLIFNHEVVDFLKEHFMERSQVILGGNAGNMANVLSDLGAHLIVPNIASHSKRQAELFRRENIKIPIQQKDKLVLLHPMDASFENEEVIHFVFDYNKGTQIHLENLNFTVPQDDRFIATYDTANIALTVNPYFEDYCQKSAASFDGALLAGFHLLLKKYPDGTTYKDKIDRFAEHTKCWKQHNPNMFIHVELGYFHSDTVESYILKNLTHVDSLGMNEIELSRCTLLKHDKKLTRGIENLQIQDITQAALQILHTTNLNRICIHTSEFVLSTFKKEFLNPTIEIEALTFGTKTAASFAATGKHGNRHYIQQTTKNMPKSHTGTTQTKKIQQKHNSTTHKEGIYIETKNHYICTVPATHCEKPLTTVGLGDTFTAATFLRELELTKQTTKNNTLI